METSPKNETRHMCVHDLVDRHNTTWDKTKVESLFRERYAKKLGYSNVDVSSEDKLLWKYNFDGTYTVRTQLILCSWKRS